MLTLQVRKRLGEFALEAALAVPARGVLVLVGESGSGKTTLLRLMAGLLRPDEGSITLAGRTLADTAAGLFLPAQGRSVGYVAQDYALFPHLSVRANVAFGLEAAGVARARRREAVALALARVGLVGFEGRRPHQLSGGQQQRAALARALVLEPEVLLLDEPLAALDRATRRAVRVELRALLADLSCITVFVTHDPSEGLAFGEHIAVIEGGRVTQVGPREELLMRPRTRYIADFLGTNLFRVSIARREPSGLARLAVEGGEIVAAECGLDGEGFALVDPREIALSLDPAAGSAQNAIRGVVLDVQPEPPSGDRVRIALASHPPLVAEVTRASVESLALAPGREVTALFKATGVRVFQ